MSLISSGSIPSPENQYILIHIPKTGGTSFLIMLMDYLQPFQMFPNAYEYFLKYRDNYNKVGQILKLPDSNLRQQRQWFASHLSYPVARELFPSGNLFTFVRNPLDRAISELVHLKIRDQTYRHLSWEEIIEIRKHSLGISQALMFGYRPGKQNLQEAIENLHQTYFVGITGHLDESIRLLSQMTATPFKMQHAVNLGAPEVLDEVRHQYGPRIKDLLEVDEAFYQVARQIFTAHLHPNL